MKKLTDKELQIMEVLWEKGPLSTRDIIGHLPDTSAHFNTIATLRTVCVAHEQRQHRPFLWRLLYGFHLTTGEAPRGERRRVEGTH